MRHLRIRTHILLFVLILLFSDTAFASNEIYSAIPKNDSEIDSRDQQNTASVTGSVRDNYLCQQISNTYKAAKKRSRRSSFKGYCGAYVANQLVVLGINKSYLSANGKNTFDIYRKMSCTSGGYTVNSYSSKEYALSQALNEILKKNPSPRNILVGFQKGTSKSGKKYGHVLFIHGIQNGSVYFSDSSARTIDNTKYKEGEPIVCSLSSFLSHYANYKLDGVVLFLKNESVNNDYQTLKAEKAADTNSEKSLITG